jgi:hypothetical protein
LLDARKALRDALEGIGVPTEWTRDDVAVDEALAAQQEQMQMAQAMEMMGQGAETAKNLAQAQADMEPIV